MGCTVVQKQHSISLRPGGHERLGSKSVVFMPIAHILEVLRPNFTTHGLDFPSQLSKQSAAAVGPIGANHT